ncbi:MAG: hypothetical protein AAB916_02625 [Patescibacteria group bacterium]
MQKILLIIVIIAVLGGGWWYIYQDQQSPAPIAPADNRSETAPVAEKSPTPDAVLVSYTDTGFAPASVTVKKGTTVTFRNESSQEIWPASAMHPTHTGYPTTGGCRGSTFDACHGLKTGESWSFTFDAVGTWKYHDHLHAGQFGSVTVVE